MRVIHDLGSNIRVLLGHSELFTYDYESALPREEAPRPFLHPIRSLSGDVVTGFRPTDHPWHHGLSMTMAVLSEGNFWGGSSYDRVEGYVMKRNHGRIVHVEQPVPYLREDFCGFTGDVGWIGPDGSPWIREKRRVDVPTVRETDSLYDILLGFALTNLRDTPLEFGSPTTEGRPNAGYGGLFWRGPRSFTGGSVLTAETQGDEESMGTRSPWLAFSGRHDGSNNETTLVFVDAPTNPRHPTQWFVRSRPIPAVSFAFSFDTIFSLPPGESVELRYRVTIANGALDRRRIVEIATRAW